MSGLVSSLVSSLSLLTAASVSETTVVFNGCVSLVVGCCSIIGRYPPGSVDQVRWAPRIPVHEPIVRMRTSFDKHARRNSRTGWRVPEHHEAGPDPQVRPASRGESWH